MEFILIQHILTTKIKDGAYIRNLDENEELVTYWSASCCKDHKIVKISAFNIFPKKLKNLLDIKTQKQTNFEHNQTIR